MGDGGDDAVPCAFCGEAFSAGADPCLAAAHARIAELEAAVTDAEERGARAFAEWLETDGPKHFGLYDTAIGFLESFDMWRAARAAKEG